MAEKLTEARVRSAEPPTDGRGQVILYDSEVRGFGLRVTKGGAKSFVLSYRNRVGRGHRFTIGAYPSWPVAAAREEARKLKREIGGGGDPLEAWREKREALTVDELADRYLSQHVEKKNRESSHKNNKALLDQWIKPEIGKLKVYEVRNQHLDRLHAKITAAGTPTRANRALAVVSKMMSLAVKWEMRADNPTRGVERNRENKRTRYLTPEELGRLIRAIGEHEDEVSANAIRLLILTGARSGEVMGAKVGNFDLKARIWTKPGATTKQRTEHRVPLSAPAISLIEEAVEGRRRTDPLFPGLTRRKLRVFWDDVCVAAKIEDVRIHDLRHAFASFLVSAGLSLPVIGALLGHTTPTTTARYAHLLDNPLRDATERVGTLWTDALQPKRLT